MNFKRIKYTYFVFIGFLLSGCEYAFDPLLPNETLHFTIYGTLDASRESQVIRVGLVRETTETTPDPIDATVTLEHLGSGTTVTLRDSLYSYGEDTWAWNYITDMEIEPGESYKLTATRSDGKSSTTMATAPDDYPQPHYVVHCDESLPSEIQIYIEGVDNLVVINMIYNYRRGRQNIIRSAHLEHIRDVRRLADGRNYLEFNIQDDLQQIADDRLIDRGGIRPLRPAGYELYMVSAGPDWPVKDGASIEEVTLPGEVRNVENGVGLMAAIVSKTFEVEHICTRP